MDTQGPEAVDPADQWVLDPVTGEYRLRTDHPQVAADEQYAQSYPDAAQDAGPAFPAAGTDPGAGMGPGAAADPVGHLAGDVRPVGYGDMGGDANPVAYGDMHGGTSPVTFGDVHGDTSPVGYGDMHVEATPVGYGDMNGDTHPVAYGDMSGGTSAAAHGEPAGDTAAFTVPEQAPAPGADDALAGSTAIAATAPGANGPRTAAGSRTSGGRRAAASGGRRRAAGRSGRRKTRGRGSEGRPAVVWAAGGLGLVLVLGGVGVAMAQRHSGGPSVHAIDVGDAAAPALSTSGPMNVLLINAAGQASSDSGGQGQGSAAGADSAVLLHLSADRGDATAVIIPGDLVTAIPDCPVRQGNGTTSVVRGTPVTGTSPTFRESLGAQGRDPGCTMRTVDQLTGVKVDHFVLADARAIQELTTAAGGVQVCLKAPLSDPAAHLDLAAGQHRLTAAQAPGFLTTRSAPPGHGDVDAARLQQAYFGALLRQWKSGGTPVGKDLADASARTLAVDPALARSGALDTLAGEIGKVDVTHVTFAALPTAKASGGARAATLDKAAAAQLFSLVTRDVPLSAEPPAPDPKLAGPKATPHDTRVTVLNGTGDFGASQDVLNWLQNDKGVNRSANGGDAPAALAATRLDYAPNQADQARSLAAMMGLPASALHEGAKDVPPLTYMTLTLGKDYTAPGTPIAPPLTAPKGLETATADSTACVG
ncbi:LCP family protein [Streptomyces sp. NPDC020917]|uniref:LCP family glycopolymer transferase n=1 Tax=Streptomyces sp. NPDC020917 TaxID=3365102 RepID=UPI0037B3CBD0